jgi:F-type H+-transporting ATPase subunit c
METEAVRVLAAAFAVSIGGIGAAVGEGMIATKAMDSIGRNPEIQDKLAPLVFVTMAITESTAIYALVVSLIILFV